MSLFPIARWYLKENSSLSEKKFLDSTSFCLKTTTHLSPRTYRILRWTRHQVFSFTEWQTCNRSAFASRFCKYCGKAYRARIWSSSNSESGGGVAMLSAESQVEAMLGWWKVSSLTRKSSCSARSWYSERCLSSVNRLWSLLGSWPVRDGSSANEQTLNLT